LPILVRTLGLSQTTSEFSASDGPLLAISCFIGDDDINPFTGLLIRGPQNIQPARLSSQAEDEDVFRLAPVPAHVS